MSLQQDIDLTPFNTLALPGKAARYLKITSPEQLSAAALTSGKRFILGGGDMSFLMAGARDRASFLHGLKL